MLTIKGELLALKEDGALGDLKTRVRGKVIVPSDGETYNDARKVWNAMIDRKPGMIVVCKGNADVVQCIKFAKEHSLVVTVRGGGHNIAGKSLANDAMLIDLSQWRTVNVNPTKQIANISPGATLRDIDHETKEYGLALPTGINSTTGISGLTLGGGYGWISRKFGMTIDSLISANVVTAEGDTMYCDESNAADLFWAIRGGSGNFGVVTNFEFKLHKVGPMVTAGPIVFPVEEAATVLRGIAAIGEQGNEDLCAWSIFRQAPPFPFVPDDYHFKPVLIVAVCFIGDPQDADAVIGPIKNLGPVLGHGVGRVPFTDWQQAFDPLLTPGFRNYWKTNNFAALTPAIVDVLIDKAKNLPNFGSELILAHLGGYMKRVDPSTTAYPHRSPEYLINCHTRWETPEEDAENIGFARDLFVSLSPHSDGTTYSNFVSEGDESKEAVFGPNLAKLMDIKAKYDPTNFFSVNYNIRPSA